MIKYPTDLNGFIESGYALLQNVASDELRSSIHDAASALRDGAKGTRRQVLYTHGPVPAGTPPLTDLTDQWLNPFLLNGDGSTCAVVVTKHEEPLCRR